MLRVPNQYYPKNTYCKTYMRSDSV
jgi:hypothetical protein